MGQPAIKLISVKDVEKYMSDPRTVFADLRDREDFEEKHIGRAFCLPARKIENKDYCLARECHYILYCDHGGASMQGALLLQNAGFDVSSLAGGIYEYSIYEKQHGNEKI